MPLIRTFVDTGILIAAARGVGDEATSALEILKDTSREFAASQFLKLEVLPKAIFNQITLEVTFYETYFQAVRYWGTDISQSLKPDIVKLPNSVWLLWTLYTLSQP